MGRTQSKDGRIDTPSLAAFVTQDDIVPLDERAAAVMMRSWIVMSYGWIGEWESHPVAWYRAGMRQTITWLGQ